MEDERFRYFQEGINKLKELEEEKLIQEMTYAKQPKEAGGQTGFSTKEVQMAV